MTLSKRLLPILAAFALLLGCALAAQQSEAEPDAYSDRVVQILELQGTPQPEDHRLRMRFLTNAIVYHDLCNPIAIGRDGLQVGTPIDDPFILGPRPAIECAAISQESVIIGYILSQARSIVTSRDPNIIYLADEDQNFIMKLQFLD